MNAERQHTELSAVARKQLFILEKLNEEWELSGQSIKPLKFGWQRYERWEIQAGIDDDGQLMNLLQGLVKNELLARAEWINPAR